MTTRFDVDGKVVDLLRKRRYDSWPFAILYAIWILGLFFVDAYVILRGVLAVYIWVFLLAVWSVDFKCFLLYSKVKDIQDANACRITPPRFCGSKQVVPLHFQELTYFDFRKQRFIYSNEKNTFCKLSYPSKETFRYYLKTTGYATTPEVQLAEHKWGLNVLEYPGPTFQKLMKHKCMEPLFLFQVFYAGIQSWYDVLVLLLLLESLRAKAQLETLSKLGHASVYSQKLMVYRRGEWTAVSGTGLLPGDLVSVGKNREEKSVPADMLILAGTAIVNEAILTGESTPQWKVSIRGRGAEEHLSCKRDKIHVLFAGTKILHHTPDESFDLKTPDGGCLAIVLRTGFQTSQGKLMRTILFSTERAAANSLEIGAIILFLVVLAITAACRTLVEGPEDANGSRYQILPTYSLVLTSAFPVGMPAMLSIAVVMSWITLRLRGIFCREPSHVQFAGKVDLCCFDKTGTLTSDKMEFSGFGGLNDNVDLITDTSEVPARTLEILASCHALVCEDNKLVGDPLEKAAIKGIQRSCKKAMPNKGGEIIAHALQRHHFASHLKRMAVVVCIEEQIFAFVKGAPETIQERLNDMPASYVSSYKRYTREGSRVLALAFKPLPDMTESEARNLDREVVESGLTFAGFAVFKCPIRGDSAIVLSELKRSSHDLVMLTGDEALTACHVARQVHIISKPALILAPTKSKKRHEWISPDETEIIAYSEEKVEALAEDHDLCIGGDCFQMLLQTSGLVKVIPYVKVFARVAPEQKEVIITTFKSLGRITLMCGDGTNDVRALRQAHVGVALPNLTPAEHGAKLGHASMASLFTAKHASVSPTTDIIRQSRSTLVTMLQSLKFLVLDRLAVDTVGLGDAQRITIAVFDVSNFLLMSHARPLPTLSAQWLHPNVVWFYVVPTILGQFALHMLFLISCMNEAQKHMKPDLVKTVFYMARLMICLASFGVNYMGRPFNQSISENKAFRMGLLSGVVLLMVVILGKFKYLTEWLELVPLAREMREKLLIWGAIMLIGCYTWDRLLTWALPAKMPTHQKVVFDQPLEIFVS